MYASLYTYVCDGVVYCTTYKSGSGCWIRAVKLAHLQHTILFTNLIYLITYDYKQIGVQYTLPPLLLLLLLLRANSDTSDQMCGKPLHVYII